jgi:TRAP-type mannitol/chloroaromatic compound transport system permease small subunit
MAGQAVVAGRLSLMALQGISEIIKRIAALERHAIGVEFKYEKPLE